MIAIQDRCCYIHLEHSFHVVRIDLSHCECCLGFLSAAGGYEHKGVFTFIKLVPCRLFQRVSIGHDSAQSIPKVAGIIAHYLQRTIKE